MADKYISHGDTYCGDGTTSAAAASNGAVGAWNDFIAAVSGSPAYGALVTGDVVYIRSEKSAVNLTQTMTANLVFMEGDYDNTITFIFDNGIVWTGDNGEFELKTGSGYAVTLSDWTTFVGQDSLKIIHSAVKNGYFNWIIGKNSHMSNVHFQTYKESNGVARILAYNESIMIFRNCTFEIRGLHSTARTCPIYSYNQSVLYLYNCEVNFSDLHTQRNMGIFYNSGYYSRIYVKGLSIVGDYVGLCLTQTTSSGASYHSGVTQIQNVESDGNLSFTSYNFTTDRPTTIQLMYHASGLDGKPFDFHQENNVGMYSEWREGNSYPTLNATLPDGTTKWSILNYPLFSSPGRISRSPDMNILFDGVSATRKITLEMLISDDYTTPKNNEWWLDVYYFDSTGEVRHETTYVYNTNIPASTAAWSTTMYGTQAYSKYKLELTTAHSIQQYSWVLAIVNCGKKAPGTDDYFFIDPEFTIGTP